MTTIRILLSILASLSIMTGSSEAQTTQSHAPPAAPRDLVQYAPDRDYDLIHVAIDLTLDYDHRAFHGVVVHTLTLLRDDVTSVRMHCGQNLKIESCEIDGKPSPFDHRDGFLTIHSAPPLTPGKQIKALVRYSGGQEVPGQKGSHWITPTQTEPARVGFWTLGEPQLNYQWVPIWDYPNDFATSETRVTVPASWSVFSNGKLQSDTATADGKARTFHWKMDQPHATYLISIIAAPFDISRSQWHGIPLIYAVPKGKEALIDDTFRETPAMLTFYSDLTGVPYPWPKYSQAITYDFPGGMENISATTINSGTLADRRNGLDPSAAGVAHEMAHQWFGDLVTCNNWGDIWLNEGFATFFQKLYFERTRGPASYQHEIQGLVAGSFATTLPLATRHYSDPMAMFETSIYCKGAATLHCLRRTLGDKVFFAGIHHYLVKYAHQPVDSQDFCAAVTEASGINLEPFFDQWVWKPGHPVLDYTWSWDEARRQILLHVAQTQDTSSGTPIYDMNLSVAVLSGDAVKIETTHIDRPNQDVAIAANRKPDALLLDPTHDYPLEIPQLHWSPDELPFILKLAPNAVDRERALARLMEGTPSDAAVQLIADQVRADRGTATVFQTVTALGRLRREDLRLLFRDQLYHPSINRRAQSIFALGALPANDADATALRRLINDDEPYVVVRAALTALGNWAPSRNRDVFERATKMPSPYQRTQLAAFEGLRNADIADGKGANDPYPEITTLARKTLEQWANPTTANPKGDPTLRLWLKNLKSFTFTMRDDLHARGISRAGSPIAYVYYYKLTTAPESWYIGFSLTQDNRIVGHVRFRVESDS